VVQNYPYFNPIVWTHFFNTLRYGIIKREFTDLEDLRLLYRDNKILSDLFSSSTHSIRQISKDE
jgi:hypothetical protein